MTRQVVLRHPSSAHRHHPLLLSPSKSSFSFSSPGSSHRRNQSASINGRRRSVGEIAGSTAAECTAVCCCCPCTLLNLLFLTVYKLPACLCRRALHRPRRHKGLPQRRFQAVAGTGDVSPVVSLQWDKDVMQLEKEMWDQFDSTGFWRSPSQREKSLNE